MGLYSRRQAIRMVAPSAGADGKLKGLTVETPALVPAELHAFCMHGKALRALDFFGQELCAFGQPLAEPLQPDQFLECSNHCPIVAETEIDAISVLDGYTVRRLAGPGERNYRIHESRAGKVWSLYSDGVMEFVNGTWQRYPLPSIRNEIQISPRRSLLLPAEEDRVLLLVPDQLFEFRSLTRRMRQTTLVLVAALALTVVLATPAVPVPATGPDDERAARSIERLAVPPPPDLRRCGQWQDEAC